MVDRSRRRTWALVACPDPHHAGARAQGDGKRVTRTGPWQDYRCRPTTGKRHRFSRLIGPPSPVAG